MISLIVRELQTTGGRAVPGGGDPDSAWLGAGQQTDSRRASGSSQASVASLPAKLRYTQQSTNTDNLESRIVF